MSQCTSGRIDDLVEEFLGRLRRGEQPDAEEYAHQYPLLAEEIRDVFPMLEMMERGKPAIDDVAAPAAAAFDPQFPLVLGDYRLISEVGRGGMGVVYEAEQLSLSRQVALKVLPPKSAANPKHLVRFRREARAAARLHHTNIVPVFEVGEHEGIHYYAMQFIRGRSLDEVVSEIVGKASTDRQTRTKALVHTIDGSPSAESSPSSRARHATLDASLPASSGRTTDTYYFSVARIGAQVADALAYSHAQGILHRDIKPANILLDVDGTVWVTDFGLAKDDTEALTRTGDVLGTFRYMAPECFSHGAEPRSDVYSLGLTLYELLTLRPAFAQHPNSPSTADHAHRRALVRPRTVDPRIPRDLETIVLKATAVEPAQRYATANDLEDDLRRFIDQLPIRARPITAVQQAWMWCRRNPRIAALLGAVAAFFVLTCLGASAAHILRGQRDLAVAAERDARNAEREALAQGKLAEGISLRQSDLPESKRKSLAALREAVELTRSEALRRRIRDDAISALAMTDIEIETVPFDRLFPHPPIEPRVPNDVSRSLPTETLEFDHDRAMPPATMLHGRQIVSHAIDQGCSRIALADAANEQVTIHDIATGKQLHSLEQTTWHPSPAEARLLFSPKSNWLAVSSSSADGQLRIARADRGSWLYHYSNTWAFDFSPDDRWLAIARSSTTVVILDLATGNEISEITVPHIVHCIAFSPDGQRLAACYGDHIPRVSVIDVKNATIAADLELSSYGAVYVAWHPDGRYLALALGTGCRAEVWDIQQRQMVCSTVGPLWYARACKFDHDGRLLTTASWDGVIRIWNALTGHLVRQLPRSLLLESTMVGSAITDTGIELVRLDPPRSLRTFRGPFRYAVLDASFSPDGRLVVTSVGTQNMSARHLEVWDTSSGRLLASAAGDRIGRHRWTDPGDALLVITRSGLLRFPLEWTDSTSVTLGPPIAHSRSARRLGSDLRRDGQRWCEILSGKLLVHSLNFGENTTAEFAIPITHEHVCLSTDGRWAVTHGWHAPTTMVWDLERGTLHHELPLGNRTIVSMATPTHFWTQRQSSYQAWDLQHGTCMATIPRMDTTHPGPLDIDATGTLAVMSLTHDALHLVRLPSCESLCRLHWPGASRLSFVTMDPAGSRILGRLSDDALAIWDLSILDQELRELGLDLADLRLPAAVSDPAPVDQARFVGFDEWIYSAPISSLSESQARDRIETLDHELQQQPDSELRLIALAEALLAAPPQLRDAARARELAAQALEHSPHDSAIRHTLALALLENRQVEDALELLLKSARESDSRWQARDLFVLAMCYAARDRLQEADDIMHVARRLSTWESQNPSPFASQASDETDRLADRARQFLEAEKARDTTSTTSP